MPDLEDRVSTHYGSAALLDCILEGLKALGVDPERPQPADLKPVDEFHIGGLRATRDLVEKIEIQPGARVLDIGSGLGGTARFVASEIGCHVTGIDLTPEFVDVATKLSALSSLSDRTVFEIGSATAMQFEDAAFDLAFLVHVGMNIPDKAALMAEAARVLKRDGRFAIYDVMRIGEGDLTYPVPWAADAETSFVATPEDYAQAAEKAGFAVDATCERRGFALDFFNGMTAAIAESGPPPLGLHLLMGERAPLMVANMILNIEAGRIAPVEIILKRKSD